MRTEAVKRECGTPAIGRYGRRERNDIPHMFF